MNMDLGASLVQGSKSLLYSRLDCLIKEKVLTLNLSVDGLRGQVV